jgi:hypothetical protein
MISILNILTDDIVELQVKFEPNEIWTSNIFIDSILFQ